LEEVSEPPVLLWPDVVPAVNVFQAMATQWRCGAFGRTGLDYSAIPTVFRLLGLPKKEWSEVFDDLRTMEGEALVIMQENSEKANG
jgi:hypothetical protein